MEAVRSKIGAAFGVDSANPIVDIIIQIIQMLLSGGVCPTPTPKGRAEWALKHPRIAKLRAAFVALNVTNDWETSTAYANTINDKDLPGYADAELDAVMAAAPPG